MMESKLKKILTSKISLFLMLLIIIWIFLAAIKVLYQRHQLDKEIATLKNEINKVDKNDQELSKLLEYFNSQSFIEKEAKEKLNMKREGESVFIVPQAALDAQLASSSPQTVEQNQMSTKPAEEENNFVKWWKYFFAK